MKSSRQVSRQAKSTLATCPRHLRHIKYASGVYLVFKLHARVHGRVAVEEVNAAFLDCTVCCREVERHHAKSSTELAASAVGEIAEDSRQGRATVSWDGVIDTAGMRGAASR